MHVFTESAAKSEPRKGEPEKTTIIRENTEGSTTQATESQVTGGKVRKTKKLTVTWSKDAYCRRAKASVGMSGSELLINHNGIVV